MGSQPWDESSSVEIFSSYNFSFFKEKRLPGHPAHMTSPVKRHRSTLLDATLGAGCLQAVAQSRPVGRLSLALECSRGGGGMSCAIALQSDEAREEG